jgi:bicarbonate transport system ATP-binding protein
LGGFTAQISRFQHILPLSTAQINCSGSDLPFFRKPEVLILDEPFGALDAITKEELQEELLKIWNTQSCTVLMITHDIDEALFLADRLVMMTNGPAAGIGEVLPINFPRPRSREDIMEDPKYYELRNTALDFLYNRFAHDADEA